MRVRAKQKIQMKAAQQNCQITYSAQEGSKWNAYYEPDVVAYTIEIDSRSKEN